MHEVQIVDVERNGNLHYQAQCLDCKFVGGLHIVKRNVDKTHNRATHEKVIHENETK